MPYKKNLVTLDHDISVVYSIHISFSDLHAWQYAERSLGISHRPRFIGNLSSGLWLHIERVVLQAPAIWTRPRHKQWYITLGGGGHIATMVPEGDWGPVSISHKTCYRKISQSLDGTIFVFRVVGSLWNLTGVSAAVLPRGLSNFKTIWWFVLGISMIREILRYRVFCNIETAPIRCWQISVSCWLWNKNTPANCGRTGPYT